MTCLSHHKKSFPLGARILLSCIALVFLAGGTWFFLVQQKHQRGQVAEKLWSIANLKAKQIAEWRGERIGDAWVLMERRALAASIQRFLSGNGTQESSEILRRLRSVKERYNYKDIFLVDPQTELRLALELEKRGPEEKGYVEAFETAMAECRPVWSRFHIGPVQSSPHLGIVVPVVSVKNDEKPVGALVLVSDASQFLYPLIQSWPTPSDTAETLLVRRDGDEVLFLNELRHQRDTALKLRIPVSRSDLPAARAVEGETGLVEGKDYRGVDVVAAILPVQDSPWFMISKMDMTEAFAEWRFRSALILVFLLAGLGLVVVAWFLIAQRQQKAYYRRLYNTEADLSRAHRQHTITLQAIGDGVISTDADGRVEFINPMAEKLTGWRQDTARGKNLTEVLQLMTEETGAFLESPAVKAMREDRIVSLAADTLLVSRDGRKIPVADSASPIRNEQGRPVGAVIVFNDRSEAREYQKRIIESEEKYRLLANNTLDVIWTLDMDLNFTYVNPAIQKHTGWKPEEYVGKHLRELCEEEQYARMTEILARELARPLAHQGVMFETELFRKDGSKIPLEVRALIIFDEGRHPLGVQGTARDIAERIEREKAMQHLRDELSEARKMEAIGRLAGGVAHDYNNMLNIITGYAELGMAKLDPEDPLHTDLQQITKAAERAAGITRKLLAFARKQMIIGKAIDLNRELTGIEDELQQQLGENVGLVFRPGSELWPVKMDPSQLGQIMSNLCANARDAMDGTGQVTIETDNVGFDAAFCENHPGFSPGDFVMLSFVDDGKGMDKEILENVFEPFFTTKPFGESAGLGLAVVYGIVKQHNGFFDVSSEPGKGTSFRLYLPRHTALGES